MADREAAAKGCPFHLQKLKEEERKEPDLVPKDVMLTQSAHRQVKDFPRTANCAGFDDGCPFKGGADAAHPHILSTDAIKEIREKCDGFSEGQCPFTGTTKHPKVPSVALYPLCKAFKEGGCPFAKGSDAHPAIQLTVAIEKCPAFIGMASASVSTGKSKCPFSGASLHPQADDISNLKSCPAFSEGCPFKLSSEMKLHPQLKLDEEFLQYLREKCPAFSAADGSMQCPLSKYKSFGEMDLSKCPAFKEACPFDRKNPKYPKVAAIFSRGILKCAAFKDGKCMFKPASYAHPEDRCPFISGLTSHPEVMQLEAARKLCLGFKQSNGCPFREASKDDIHRYLGMDEVAISIIKTKCPGFREGCPFAPNSSAHPPLTCAADAKKCPAMAGGCIFDAAAGNDGHPNVAYLLKSSLAECSAFKRGKCMFAHLGMSAPSKPLAESIQATKAMCPKFASGCPWRGVETMKDFFESFKDIPTSHFNTSSSPWSIVEQMVRYMKARMGDSDSATSSKVLLPTDHPLIDDETLRDVQKRHPELLSKRNCPFSEHWEQKKHCGESKAAVEFANIMMYCHMRSSAADLSKCPLWKDESACPFHVSDEREEKFPFKTLLTKCPAFAEGSCPYKS